jgi:uncharacterized protein
MSVKAWLPLIWGEVEPGWVDRDEASRVRATVQARHDQVARQLAEDPDSYAPILRTLPDGTVVAEDWARGFQAGMGLHTREWDVLTKNPQTKHFMVTILVQLPDWDEKIMGDLGRNAVLEFRRQGQEFIGYCVAQIQRFWAKQQESRQTRRTPTARLC